MFKKLIILCLLAAPLGVFAQEKIAYINSQEIFYQMPEISGVETRINAKQEEIKNNLQAMETEFKNLQESFQKDTTALSPSVLESRQTQLDQVEQRYQTYVQNSQRELQELSQKEQAPLIEKLQKAIQDVGQEQGYTYIIERTAAPFVSTGAVDAGKFVKAKLGIK